MTAKKFVDRLHDEFWEVSDEKLTEEEFKIFLRSLNIELGNKQSFILS